MAHVRPRKHGTLCKFFWYVNYFPISFWKDLYQVLLRIYLCQCWTVKFKGITHQMLFYNFLLGFCHPSKTQYVWRMLVIYFKNGSAIIREQQGCIYFKVVHFFPIRARPGSIVSPISFLYFCALCAFWLILWPQPPPHPLNYMAHCKVNSPEHLKNGEIFFWDTP